MPATTDAIQLAKSRIDRDDLVQARRRRNKAKPRREARRIERARAKSQAVSRRRTIDAPGMGWEGKVKQQRHK